VLVDELVFIDLCGGDVALGEDLDALGGELGDDEVLHRAGVGVGLDEDEGGVHEGRGGEGAADPPSELESFLGRIFLTAPLTPLTAPLRNAPRPITFGSSAVD
jgi:hypothetical protein